MTFGSGAEFPRGGPGLGCGSGKADQPGIELRNARLQHCTGVIRRINGDPDWSYPEEPIAARTTTTHNTLRTACDVVIGFSCRFCGRTGKRESRSSGFPVCNQGGEFALKLRPVPFGGAEQPTGLAALRIDEQGRRQADYRQRQKGAQLVGDV